MRFTSKLAYLLICVASPGAVTAEEFVLVAWNLESGGIQRSTIGSQLRGFEGVDLWALSEVQDSNADHFIASAGQGEDGEFSGIIGNTGGADRLLVIVNETRFDIVDAYELSDLALGGRAPLVVQLKSRDSEAEFLLVAVHLHRRDGDKRLTQARELRAWVADSTLPVLAAGDFNFDYDIPDGPGNAAFLEFARGDVLQWEEPESLVATQFSDNDADGENDFNSVLDFVWSAGAAQDWDLESEILVRRGDFPDDDRTTDHRPVLAWFDTSEARPRMAAYSDKVRIADSRPTRSLRHRRTPAVRSAPLASTDRPYAQRQQPAYAEEFGHFEGQVAAVWDDAGRDMTLLEDFHYIDGRGKRWTAPRDATVNGASIPRAFWSVIGGPFEGRYRNASVVHDVYCQNRERPWGDVHRMFYEACRCGGVGSVKAKVMYYAVYHFGPRWDENGSPRAGFSGPGLEDSEVAAVEAFIKWRDPSLSELESLSPAAFNRRVE